ncbi:hypothetical protein AU255_13885 [Methyloprofundus sedimenti]|uniref:Uncharacterized protein n=1 Tax=Methyloprofundus sedimenti TaxID=1420851 RepID=A0A1V8M3P4_9GAMM|nr:hypothetical protein [Methyloprofundus sedimenti]OQK16187.1 hypothetical protein AU255_13885 [Methyloprofundus sedimenti]
MRATIFRENGDGVRPVSVAKSYVATNYPAARGINRFEEQDLPFYSNIIEQTSEAEKLHRVLIEETIVNISRNL